MDKLKLPEKKAIQVIRSAKQFKYADRIGQDDPDENQIAAGVVY